MYASSGTKLKPQQTRPDARGMLHCAYCGSYVRRATKEPQGASDLAAAAGGALVGAALGGPPGALIGGIIGLLFSKAKEGQQK